MDTNTIAMMSMIMGSWITIFVAILWQSNRHEDSIKSLDTKFTTLDTKFDALESRFDALEPRFDKLDGRFDVMGRDLSDARERLARIEGHLLGPESFRAPGVGPAGSGGLSPQDPNPGHHEAD